MLQILATPGRRVRLRAMNITAKPARLKMFMPNKRSLVSIAPAPRNRRHCERSEAISCRVCLVPSRLLRRCAPRNDKPDRLPLARDPPMQRLGVEGRAYLGVVVEIDIDVA